MALAPDLKQLEVARAGPGITPHEGDACKPAWIAEPALIPARHQQIFRFGPAIEPSAEVSRHCVGHLVLFRAGVEANPPVGGDDPEVAPVGRPDIGRSLPESADIIAERPERLREHRQRDGDRERCGRVPCAYEIEPREPFGGAIEPDHHPSEGVPDQMRQKAWSGRKQREPTEIESCYQGEKALAP